MHPTHFKLEKLKIHAYKNVARTDVVSVFEAMFNPVSFKQQYAIVWATNQGFNTSGAQVDYARTKPSEVTLDLVIDGTGVSCASDGSADARKTVRQRVDELLSATYRYNGEIHEPNYLTVVWAGQSFACRLSNADINYTLFDRDGTPLRAEVSVTLLADDEARQRMRRENKTSPDLTHARLVRSGDTLPLMTRAIYGSSEYHLRVARYNGLNDLRNLAPGTELVFPPLVSLLDGKASE